jgi:hypothetical protein
MVDPLHVEVGIEQVPVRNLISGDDTAGYDPLAGVVHNQGLSQEGPCQCTTAAWPQDEHYAARDAAITQSPPVDPQSGWPRCRPTSGRPHATRRDRQRRRLAHAIGR